MKKQTILSFVVVCILAVSLTTSVRAADNTTTDETSEINTVIDNYNESNDMTDQQVLEYFEEFLALNNISTDSMESVGQEVLEEFVSYAIDEGIIGDTPAQQAAVKKVVIRETLLVAVEYGNSSGYTTAATLLEHSLQDSPTDLNYSSSSKYAKQILNSSECAEIISDFKTYITGKSLLKWTVSGSTTLNSTTDLHLAYNKVSYKAIGTKNNDGTWTLKITFSDTYDFEWELWKYVTTSNVVVAALNNYGALAQSTGAIVPYDIKVTVQTTFTEYLAD